MASSALALGSEMLDEGSDLRKERFDLGLQNNLPGARVFVGDDVGRVIIDRDGMDIRGRWKYMRKKKT
jgi:hypothetical protein